MKRLLADVTLLERFPELAIGVVVASGADNRLGANAAAELLSEQVVSARDAWPAERLEADPRIAVWREAYRSFGAKPKKHRCSIENMLRAILSGRTIPSINPMVDFYNAVSLEHCIPIGGDDLDRVEGDIRLTITAGGERFVPLNGTDAVALRPGEVAYCDDLDVLCRRWNWRECEKTKLTEATTDVCLVVEGLPPFSADDVLRISGELAELIETHCSARTAVQILDRDEAAVELNTL